MAITQKESTLIQDLKHSTKDNSVIVFKNCICLLLFIVIYTVNYIVIMFYFLRATENNSLYNKNNSPE